MIEWFLGCRDIIQACIIVAVVDALVLCFIAVKDGKDIKRSRKLKQFEQLEKLVGKMS